MNIQQAYPICKPENIHSSCKKPDIYSDKCIIKRIYAFEMHIKADQIQGKIGKKSGEGAGTGEEICIEWGIYAINIHNNA